MDTRLGAEIWMVTYGYSLMKDSQKELGVLAGLHHSNAMVDIRTEDGSRETTTAETPLPVIGAFGSLSVGRNWRVNARVQAFALEFDRYDGVLLNATLGAERRIGRYSAGFDYTLYYSNLESSAKRVRGELRVRHHGPVVVVGARF